ncbi:hypothetical protein BCR35DRAFT_349697 [Leucosporidium creatinivorum]|uniref:Uncharacterized protein n=1 Tax=Leucosporidium creatinivorum TaxID=106004 RepID=A0A1Y2G2U1_9BASI|nr:hypothetical protein BCR35DRAFT_349697 [Leucosporidium creatinivorum]
MASPNPSSSSSVPPPPQPHEFGSIIHSIQRRAVDRASGDHPASSWKLKRPASGDASALLHDLEEDLRLSAKVGSALLEEKAGLEKRLAAAEGANQKLLDRLTSSVKEASQLQRRLEETVNNLEQSDSNNRSLLVSLEEGRKTITRLSADSGKLVTTSAQLTSLTRTHDDLRQELTAERKRASSAEARCRKQAERSSEMDVRLKKAIEDLEEMRQDKVLRTKKSHDALAKVKAKYGRAEMLLAGGAGSFAQSPEAAELLKLVESLASENMMLRSESQDLHELLDARQEEAGHRHEGGHPEAFAEEDEHDLASIDGRRHSMISNGTSTAPNLLAEVLNSPSLSQSASRSFSDFDGSRPFSPGSTNATSFNRSWAPTHSHSLSHSQRGANLSRTLSTGSTSAGEEPSRHGSFHYNLPESRRASKRQSIGGTASSGVLGLGMPPSSSGRVPVGRGHSRRAMSVDVSSLRSTDLERRLGDSAPGSPSLESASGRPPSLYSVASENDDSSTRPRRHHRPLSLSLGPSLFPLVPEDDQASSPRSASSHRRRPSSQLNGVSQSTSGITSLTSAPSGISLSSPTRPKRPRRATSEERPTVLVDTSTQTSPRPIRPSLIHPIHSTPRQGSSRSHSPQPDITRSNTSTSELSDPDRYLDLGFAPGQVDSRTAVLGTLIEHTSKILARIQSADITTQEKRFKKQNLPGDVRHLAQANLKDVLSDIEGLRHHFRRVLEQERSTAAREGTSASESNSSDSLVNRRDFVTLVKLFRDLLFETSRLRSLVNRVSLEPHLASSIRELDVPNSIDTERAPKSSGGLLAPLSRLFGAALSTEPEPASPKTPTTLRPPPKRSGSSAISSTAVSVEFGAGAVRRAVATGGEGADASPDVASKDSPQASTVGRKSGSQVKRDLSSIFAGSSAAPRSGNDWVVLPTPAAPSSNPFGRLLASYRPALTSTANAVIDSIPHAPVPDEGYQPTLLERQLRPRGLSDSSIRSTFVAHANPHHRIISPATLALSSETTKASSVPILVTAGASETGSTDDSPSATGSLAAPRADLKHQLSSSLLATSPLNRKSSTNKLISKRSISQLRSVSGPALSSSPPPPLPASPISATASLPASSPPAPAPISISISPSSNLPPHLHPSATPSQSVAASGSLFGNLTNWASKATGLSPLAAAAEGEDEGRVRPNATAMGKSGPPQAERARRDLG